MGLRGAPCSPSQRSPREGSLYKAADRIRQRLGNKLGDSRPGVPSLPQNTGFFFLSWGLRVQKSFPRKTHDLTCQIPRRRARKQKNDSCLLALLVLLTPLLSNTPWAIVHMFFQNPTRIITQVPLSSAHNVYQWPPVKVTM